MNYVRLQTQTVDIKIPVEEPVADETIVIT